MKATELLATFSSDRSEQAFDELMRRYSALVFSVARRRLGDSALAEDATQTVFVRLSQNPPALSDDAELTAWLHRTALHVSIDLGRSESRRRLREQFVASISTDTTELPTGERVAPVLDAALDTLSDLDRKALLLRYFQAKPMRDLGVAMGVSEDAAKMRVSRALDRLRDILAASGIVCSAAALGAWMDDHAVHPLPGSVTKNFESKRSKHSTGTAGVLLGLRWAFSPIFVGAVVLLLAVVGVLGVRLSRASDPLTLRSEAVTPTQLVAESEAQAQALLRKASTGSNPMGDPNLPDPRQLLEGVLRARMRLRSGSMAWQLSTTHFQPGRAAETNIVDLTALFDATRQRFESTNYEYSYTETGEDGAKSQETEIRDRGLDRASAVAAGLLKRSEYHRRIAYDGSALLRYEEVDGKQLSMMIDHPQQAGSSVFDPRCLGLTPSPRPGNSVEELLLLQRAKSINLVGRELVGDISAWHIKVLAEGPVEFWVDTNHPEQLIKQAENDQEVFSQYADPRDILPGTVRRALRQNGEVVMLVKYVQTVANFNATIDPEFCTLAGMDMRRGTEVVDVRIKRRIGYWTGSGLSEGLASVNDAATSSVELPVPKLEELRARLDADPASAEALSAATWILLNTPDDAYVERAAKVVRKYHAQNPSLGDLCVGLERMRPRVARSLLEAIRNQNPSAEVRAIANFTLAMLRKLKAHYGADLEALAETEQLLERAGQEAAHAGPAGITWADRAKEELAALRTVSIGRPAPVTEGVDFAGVPLKLRDYRGQILVLVFWSNYLDVAPEWQKTLDRLAGQPVAIMGVNCGSDFQRQQAEVEKYGVRWRSIRDGDNGPIRRAWHNNPKNVSSNSYGESVAGDFRPPPAPFFSDQALPSPDFHPLGTGRAALGVW